MLEQLMQFLSPSAATVGGPSVPEWEGWLVLGALMAVFGTLIWWLYFSALSTARIRIVDTDVGAPLVGARGRDVRIAPSSHFDAELGTHKGRPYGTSSDSADSAPSQISLGPRARRTLAGLVLLSGFLLMVGARWDEFWHRLYGGFGNDFLWPPHLMIYGSLGLNSAFAGLGLAIAARGGGGIRERFRANPLVGLLGLLAAYELASIPSDLIWHKIIGQDISAWSLPHFLLMVSSSAVIVIGLALALAGGDGRRWHGGWPRISELTAIALLVVSTLAMLQFGVTEWEWGMGIGMPFDRAVWVYPVVVLAVGIVESHLALYAIRRVGAATAVAAIALAVQIGFVLYARALVPPGPNLASHLLLLAPAVVLDLWHARRRPWSDGLSTLVGGAALYAFVVLGECLLLLGRLLSYPSLGLGDVVPLVGLGFAVAVALAVVTRAAASWLVAGRLGESVGDRVAPATRREHLPVG